jgi:hypothetical protein
MKSKWRRYEVLLPHRFNDGRPVPNAWLGEAVNELINQFEAVSFEPRKIEGRWRSQGKLYRDLLAKLIVDVPDILHNRRWMKKFKARWEKKLKQIKIWVVSYRINLE